MFTLSQRWRETYPQAALGVLVMSGVSNPPSHPGLQRQKAELEAEVRARFGALSRAELRELPALAAYHAYYRQFGKSYHVQLQLESVALKGKTIPSVAGLVECMFVAELKNQLLTAGHDMDLVSGPVKIDVATGQETYVTLGGQEQILKMGDMYIADTEGVLSSIVYGPDRRTKIGPETTHVLFTVYAPPGISPSDVRAHLSDIAGYVKLAAPNARADLCEVYGTE